ncbi:uncharacterized protein BO87DRAFT_457846 [Aspergillus neoniger CBS 115656]|uniref:Rhodopsin domain-containing protein n=1 Tax=Aspergillus neoniger (strain CBS 115656) TaxID=1448310 RepID=A0A318Z658_ASPNB|nr:hypothetical protein BO87DRAFT_457846 [Aspergillus neoniger CBS 115656]PYH35668.1 hypothetical protein BO87DRAFT_457846 [Aspergillus neoniger CBS 115656]
MYTRREEDNLTASKQPLLYGMNILFIILSTIAIVLRFISRRIGRVRWGRDDTLIVLAWVATMAFFVIMIVDVRYGGTGLHVAYIMETDPTQSVVFSKLIIAVSIVWCVSTALSKLTILSLYITLFGINKSARYACYLTGAIVIGYSVGGFSACFAVCRPLKALWDTNVKGTCFDLNMLLRWIRLPNIVSDIAIMIIPIPYVLKLQVTGRVRLGLIVTFLFGSVGFIFGVICWSEYLKTDAVADKTWSAIYIFVWSDVEAGMYFIATCFLAYQPLVNRIWSRLSSRVAFSKNGKSAGQPENTTDRSTTPFAFSRSPTRYVEITKEQSFSVSVGDQEDTIGLVPVAHTIPEPQFGSRLSR